MFSAAFYINVSDIPEAVCWGGREWTVALSLKFLIWKMERSRNNVCKWSAWHMVSSDSAILDRTPFLPVISACVWIWNYDRRKLLNDNYFWSYYTPTHLSTPHPTARKRVLRLNGSTVLPSLWWAENSVELQIWSSRELCLRREREGRRARGLDGTGRGRLRWGEIWVAVWGSETWRKMFRKSFGGNFALCRVVYPFLHSLRSIPKGCGVGCMWSRGWMFLWTSILTVSTAWERGRQQKARFPVPSSFLLILYVYFKTTKLRLRE